MDSIQLWIAIITGVSLFGFAMFGIGVYVGIRVEQNDQADARDALSIGGGSSRRR